MAINVNNSSTVRVINVRYSAFLGMLYVSNPENESILKAARESIGETEWKKGFKGSRGDSASAVARETLKKDGIFPVTVAGLLTSARVVERIVNGRPAPYLNVGLFDREAEERYYLSIDLNQDAAQMLARKLTNAKPGVLTAISLFGTYEQKPGADRGYANHCASLRQDQGEVAGVDPRVKLAGLIEQTVAGLKAANMTDMTVVGPAKDKVRLDFHVALMTDVNEKFAQHYADREQPQAEDSEASSDRADNTPY